MTLDQCKPGVLVWAASTFGWVPAVVEGVDGRGKLLVRFQAGAGGSGVRSTARLAPRDPKARGADRPLPAAERAFATQGPPAA